MPRARVVLYQEDNGYCPFLQWFDGLPAKVQDKCYLRIERLSYWAMNCDGRKLTSFATAYTNSGSVFREQEYRIRYFFHGRIAAVVSHGIVKRSVVPPAEIDRAIERKRRYEENPHRRTYEES